MRVLWWSTSESNGVLKGFNRALVTMSACGPWSRWSDSNRLPVAYKATALPDELQRHGAVAGSRTPSVTLEVSYAAVNTSTAGGDLGRSHISRRG